jgi:hypothetical protein
MWIIHISEQGQKLQQKVTSGEYIGEGNLSLNAKIILTL